MELGIFGQFDHPLFLDAIHLITSAAKKFGKATGILFFNVSEYEKYHVVLQNSLGTHSAAVQSMAMIATSTRSAHWSGAKVLWKFSSVPASRLYSERPYTIEIWYPFANATPQRCT
jgi:hypothetical protein